MNRSNVQMNSQGSTAAFDTRLASRRTTGLDRGEALRNARIAVPFALGFVALAAALLGPAEIRGPLFDAVAIVLLLLGLAAASATSTVGRAS